MLDVIYQLRDTDPKLEYTATLRKLGEDKFSIRITSIYPNGVDAEFSGNLANIMNEAFLTYAGNPQTNDIHMSFIHAIGFVQTIEEYHEQGLDWTFNSKGVIYQAKTKISTGGDYYTITMRKAGNALEVNCYRDSDNELSNEVMIEYFNSLGDTPNYSADMLINISSKLHTFW